MELLSDDLLQLIFNYVTDTKDIYNLRLTNKKYYKLLKTIPIFKYNLKLYEINITPQNISWYHCKSNKKIKEIIFKPFGGIFVKNYEFNCLLNNNNDYNFNLPNNMSKITKDNKFIRKNTYKIIENNYSTEVIPIYQYRCDIS